MVTLDEFQAHADYESYRWLAAYLAGPKVYPLLADRGKGLTGHVWCRYCRRALRTHLRSPFCLVRDAPPLSRFGDIC